MKFASFYLGHATNNKPFYEHCECGRLYIKVLCTFFRKTVMFMNCQLFLKKTAVISFAVEEKMHYFILFYKTLKALISLYSKYLMLFYDEIFIETVAYMRMVCLTA